MSAMINQMQYKGRQEDWQFVNGPWETNEDGDIISPADSFWSMDDHKAFNILNTYGDCEVSAKWQCHYAGGANLELIVRAEDSRRYYSVKFSLQTSFPVAGHDLYIMTGIWKGSSDGYRRMVAYRKKSGFYSPKDPYKWYDVKVICEGPEISVYFEDNFVCAVRDEDYPEGFVGVACSEGKGAWKGLTVEGRPAALQRKWKLIESRTPMLFRIAGDSGVTDKQHGVAATLLSGDEILVSFAGSDKDKRYVTRSADYGTSWEKPVLGRSGCYVRSLGEVWSVERKNRPGVTWQDSVFNFDELIMDNFWFELSRSKDDGRTWGAPEKMSIPFPDGKAYEARKGKAGSALFTYASPPLELSDGSIIIMAFWRNSPDGAYTSDQVQCLRTTDGGRTFSIYPVDASNWEGNESTCIQFPDSSLFCVMRSNYSNFCWGSNSYDFGKTWSRVRPLIPFFGSSFPSALLTRNGVLVLATRGLGIFTSTDRGITWKMPVYTGGYTGSGEGANLLEMKDGRILIISSTHGNAPDGHARIMGQFIRVDEKGEVHPALPGIDK